jgi:chromosome partitioning protein
MRTMLITGSKGGTGKTATAINLAALLGANRQNRVLLVDADPSCSVAYYLQQDPASTGELEPLTDTGVFWPELLENGDVITPYAHGSSSQNQLEQFLKMLPEWASDQRYTTIILDAPPMLGARAKALFRFAEEVLLVLRAEPLSFQLLPSYLDLAKREKPPGRTTRFLGILMTLAMGQRPTDDGVHALRDRFKGILPTTIPHDPEMDEAMIQGQPLVWANPYAPASKAYEELAQKLKLIRPMKRVKLLGSPVVGSSPPSAG